MDTQNNIRIGTPADLDRIMPVLMRLHAENGMVDADNTKILSDVWSALNQDRGLIAFIEGDGGVIEGVVVLRIGKLWYSDRDVLEEKLVYVPPEFRNAKGGRARRLCDFTKGVADKMGIPLIIGIISNERTKGKMRLYERIFGAPAGAFFLYGGSTIPDAPQGT